MRLPLQPSSRASRTSFARIAPLAIALFGACSQGSDGGKGTSRFDGPGGELLLNATLQDGRGDRLALEAVYAGRLVDLYATGAQGEQELVTRDFVAPADVELENADWRLDYDDVFARDQLIVAHPKTARRFLDVVAALDARLERLADHGLDASELPPYSTVARNGVLVLAFDDLLDPQSVDSESIRLAVGRLGDRPFAARVFADRHHGAMIDQDGDGRLEFHPSRVIVAPAISTADVDASDITLTAQPLGLPSGAGENEPNVVLRLATDGGSRVRNASGVSLGQGGEFTEAATHDVVRSFATRPSDDEKAFLTSSVPLTIIGHQAVQVTQATPLGGGAFQLDLLYASLPCAASVQLRDTLISSNGSLLVATAPSAAPVGGVITGALFRVLTGTSPHTGAAQLSLKWQPGTTTPPACFVTFSPPPLALPARGVSPNARVSVSFNQPIDPASLGAFDTFRILDASKTSPLHRFVVGTLVTAASQSDLTFVPSLPLQHTTGLAETFEVELAGGPQGLRGTGGAQFRPAGFHTSFELDSQAAGVQSDNLVLRFSSADEDVPSFATFPTPEVRGQFLYDLANEQLVPRPVTRFSATLDASNPIVGAMIPFTQGLQTPLVPLGSKMMQAWRYHDLGFSLTEESTMNVDVEGLNWSPSVGSVNFDQFPQFQMALTHGHFLPDEVINPQSLLPKYPASGLSKTYSANVGDAASDPLTIVHPKDWGYTVAAADTFVSASGTVLQPWPLNHQLPAGQAPRYYTWRDTAQTYVGAPGGTGAETGRFVQVFGIGTPGVPYAKDAVPTVGLPLLMEFRCYPSGSSIGLNGLKIAIAINSSAAPFFRAFSSGGILAGGQPKTVDPDAEIAASGGVNPSTGFATLPTDNSVYIGQADFVVRVSRAHTIWLDTEFTAPTFAPPVIEPAAVDQPAGTQIVVAYRGATAIDNFPSASNQGSWANADNLDFYGNSKSAALGGTAMLNFTPTFLNFDSGWKPSLATLNGSKYVQARFSFIANATTNLSPRLSTFGFAYSN
ncbi:MAG: Ig-like domain-containing protein [Planctomycetes bacterium]|nr:Ig-like domain-containing protein [Planctomycetota bacterium]